MKSSSSVCRRKIDFAHKKLFHLSSLFRFSSIHHFVKVLYIFVWCICSAEDRKGDEKKRNNKYFKWSGVEKKEIFFKNEKETLHDRKI